MADERPRTKEIRLRFRGAAIDDVERLLENAGKAIGHPGEPEVVVHSALRLYAGSLGVA